MEVDASSSQSSNESIEMKTKTENNSSKSDSGEGNDSSESVTSLNSCSEMTPSDQRSNNENGSSMKESDGDAMSKKSDSSSSDKQQSSESELETKKLEYVSIMFEKMFSSLNICYPNMHRNSAPWLLEVDFTDELKYKYRVEKGDERETLLSDLTRLNELNDPDMVHDQLSSLFDDIQGNNDSAQPTNHNSHSNEWTGPNNKMDQSLSNITRDPVDVLNELGPGNEDDDEVLKSLFTCL